MYSAKSIVQCLLMHHVACLGGEETVLKTVGQKWFAGSNPVCYAILGSNSGVRVVSLYLIGRGFKSYLPNHIGKWLNLVGHYIWDVGVIGSSPIFPTISLSREAVISAGS